MMIRFKFWLLILALFVIHATTSSAQSETAGRILNFDDPMVIKVYLPPDFDENQAYPTLYLLHGQSQDANLWIRLGLQETLDELIANGRVKPLIVVMPQENNYLQDVEKSDFEKKFLGELIPFIEENFPVAKERPSRAIGGISRGAFWSQIIALKNYQLFGVLGQHSLLTAYYSTSSLVKIIRDAAYLPPMKIRIDIGNEDYYIEEEVVFADQLQRLKMPHIFIINEGKHDEAYWRRNLRDYLIWYAEALEVP